MDGDKKTSFSSKKYGGSDLLYTRQHHTTMREISCGYLLKVVLQGTSIEYPQLLSTKPYVVGSH